MKTPKITVLMSVCNGARFLHDAVRSIVNQTLNDFEFLIVNDGSTDNSLDIIKSFNDSRIRVISNKSNIGLTKSLNIGLAAAKGVYVARMDADDISLSNRLELQYKYFEKHRDITLLGGGAHFINEDNRVTRTKLRLADHDSILFYCFFNCPFIHSSVMFKRKCLDTVGMYDEFYKYAQDYDLWTRWVRCFKVANLREVIVKWRNTSTGITNTRREKQARFGRRVSVNFYRKHLPGIDHVKDEILVAIRDSRCSSLSRDDTLMANFVVNKMEQVFCHIKDAKSFKSKYVATTGRFNYLKERNKSLMYNTIKYTGKGLRKDVVESDMVLNKDQNNYLWEYGVYKNVDYQNDFKQERDKTLSVVICTLDNVELLKDICKKALESALVSQLIVVDNGSKDGTDKYLNEIKDSKLLVIRNKVNTGVIKARNKGLSKVASNYALILDDDQIPSTYTFSKYIELMELFDVVGCDLQIMNFSTGLTRLGSENEFSYVGAGGMCMRTGLWKELGFFDEIFSPAYFEDPDIVEKAKELGMTVGFVKGHGITHVAHKTLSRSDLGFDPNSVMLRNRVIFKNKYIYKISSESLVKYRVRVLCVVNQIDEFKSNIDFFKLLYERVFDFRLFVKGGFKTKQDELQFKEFHNIELYSGSVEVKNPIRKKMTVYRNTSHVVQCVMDGTGRTHTVKPGGDIAGDKCSHIGKLPSFRPLQVYVNSGSIDAVDNLKDIISEFSPHLIYCKDKGDIDYLSALRDIQAFRGAEKIPSIIQNNKLDGFSLLTALSNKGV